MGETALHAAARNGHLDVVRLLLDSGAQKNVTSKAGATALHVAAQKGHSQVVQLLGRG